MRPRSAFDPGRGGRPDASFSSQRRDEDGRAHAWPQIPIGFTVASDRAIDALLAVGIGIVTFIGVVYSLLFLVVQFGSTTFTPRLNSSEDAPIVWHAFGYFAGILVFSFTAASRSAARVSRSPVSCRSVSHRQRPERPGRRAGGRSRDPHDASERALGGGIEGLKSLLFFLAFATLSTLFVLKDGPVMRRFVNRHMGVPEQDADVVTTNVAKSLRSYSASRSSRRSTASSSGARRSSSVCRSRGRSRSSRSWVPTCRLSARGSPVPSRC